jgi:hypothetical protein
MSDLLNKMPVPYEPKRKNRWLFRFPDELGIQEFWLVSAARPTLTIADVEIPLLNTSTYVAGRFNWETIDVTLRDGIGPSTAQAVMEWNRLCAESVTGRMGYAAGYKKNVEIEMLDPTGVVVEKWVLEGTFITSSNFGDLAMDDDSLAEVQITLRPDRCILIF